MAEKLLTLKQVQEILLLSERSVFNLIKKGELHGFKAGRDWRFTESDIDDYIRQQREKEARLEARQPDVVEMIAHAVRGLPDGEREEAIAELIKILTENEHLSLKFEAHDFTRPGSESPSNELVQKAR